MTVQGKVIKATTSTVASHVGILEQRGLREAFGKLKEKTRTLIHTAAEMKIDILQTKASLQSGGGCMAVGIGKR